MSSAILELERICFQGGSIFLVNNMTYPIVYDSKFLALLEEKMHTAKPYQEVDLDMANSENNRPITAIKIPINPRTLLVVSEER